MNHITRCSVASFTLVLAASLGGSLACAGQAAPAGGEENVASTKSAVSDYKDAQPWSRELVGLPANQLPQFVAITFDDNWVVDRIQWARDLYEPLVNPAGQGNDRTFDGTPARTTFYQNCVYLDEVDVVNLQKLNFESGHEMANHTWNHPENGNPTDFTVEDWTPEISDCTDRLAEAIGATTDDILGFRNPYLKYNDATFTTLKNLGLTYDTSVQSCWGNDEDGSNCSFPYTLDDGSPDNDVTVTKFGEPVIASHPGLWEFSLHALVVPPDSVAVQYAFTPGLRERVAAEMAGKTRPDFYEASSGKIASLDFTLFEMAQMSGSEVEATLKYNFDLHLNGNRAPFVFVAHTHVYDSADRRDAIENFMTYALSKPETRMRPVQDILAWMRAPVSLTGQEPVPPTSTGGGTGSGGASASGGANASGGLGGASSTGGAPHVDKGADVDDSGCGCRVVGTQPETRSGLFAAALLGLGAFWMRRRKSLAV